jgi:hypothetical protein
MMVTAGLLMVCEKKESWPEKTAFIAINLIQFVRTTYRVLQLF